MTETNFDLLWEMVEKRSGSVDVAEPHVAGKEKKSSQSIWKRLYSGWTSTFSQTWVPLGSFWGSWHSFIEHMWGIWSERVQDSKQCGVTTFQRTLRSVFQTGTGCSLQLFSDDFNSNAVVAELCVLRKLYQLMQGRVFHLLMESRQYFCHCQVATGYCSSLCVTCFNSWWFYQQPMPIQSSHLEPYAESGQISEPP